MAYDRNGSVEKNMSGREPEGTWRQYELIGGKPPVIKYGNSYFDFEMQSVCEGKAKRLV
jgi:hypothetical protein